MIQGVHAQTLVFASYQRVHDRVLAQGWPRLGTATQYGGRDVALRGTEPRRFHLHVVDRRERAKTVCCQLELHDAKRRSAPLMRVELTFVPDGANTRVSLSGSAAVDLTPASSMQGFMSRRLANEYARALLEGIAHATEERAVETEPAFEARTPKGEGRQKTR